MNEAIPFISIFIVMFGLVITMRKNKGVASIGWVIVAIGVAINMIHCFILGKIILGIFNMIFSILDGLAAVATYKAYKESLLENREKFLNEIMKYKKQTI